MTRLLTAAALSCALTFSAVAQAPAGLTFRDQHQPDHFYRITAESPGGMPLIAQVTEGHNAKAHFVYRTSAGVRCEVFFASGQMMASRARGWSLFSRQPHVGLWIPDGQGGATVVQMPPDCPTLDKR